MSKPDNIQRCISEAIATAHDLDVDMLELGKALVEAGVALVKPMPQFADRVRAGEFQTDAAADDAFDLCVGEWHDGGTGVSLEEYLGLTHEQYAAGLTGKTEWRTILEERHG